MKQKTITIMFGILLISVFSSGILSAEYAGVLTDTSEISIDDFISGNTASADFSFSYEDYYGDSEYPHILRINISSDDLDYPVLKGDFELSGYVIKSTFFGMIKTTIGLECHEESPLTIEHPLGTNTLAVPNGTFYCYNTTSEKINKLDKNDEVFLNLKSHIALYPGEYTLTAEVFYLNDTKAPIVSIINKNVFGTNYYRDFSNIEVVAEITDGSAIADKWGIMFTPSQNITIPFSHLESGLYYFTKTLPSDIQEDDFPLYIFASDSEGNKGNDSTILRIDRTAPVITLISPLNNSVVSDIIPLKMNVTDEKSGTDNQSVYYRLREIVNGQICPEIGVPLGNYSCIRTDWINIPENLTGLYEEDVNTTNLNLTSGEYWLDVKAQDILGNEGFL